MKKLLLILFIFQIHILSAQEPLFVAAENGLIVRSGPDKSYKKIGKLNYAEKIDSYQSVKRYDEIIDGNNVIEGEWYLINTNNIEKGYVFSGFLTSNMPEKNIEIKFENFSVEFEHIDLWDSEKTLSEIQKDIVKLNIDLTGNPWDKEIKVKSNNFQKIELFQRFQNSVTISDEGPHCDLINWKHYESHWEKIPVFKNNNVFKTLEYSNTDKNQFIPIDIEELKNAVAEHCGKRWSKLITNIKNPTEIPSGVSTSKIFIKIVITDENNNVSEKIIEFTIPMGC